MRLKNNNNKIDIYSVYFPPPHNIKYQEFFLKLGHSFLVGVDFNAKHPWWSSSLSILKGKEVYKSITNNKISVLSTGSPTYWPSDARKIPDLLDFVKYFGIPSNLLDILDTDDLSSDHSPLIVNYDTFLPTERELYGTTSKTDIDSAQYWLDRNINFNIRIKDYAKLDSAVDNFTNLVHEAAYLLMPIRRNRVVASAEISRLIRNKRRLRRLWKLTKYPKRWNQLMEVDKILKKANKKNCSY